MNIQPTVASLPQPGNQLLRSATPEPQKPAETTSKAVEPAPAPVPAEPADRATVETATRVVRDFVKPINSNLEFSVIEDSGQLVVKIIDQATKDVIRQMPSEEMLAIAKALDSIKGLFVTQTA